MPHWSGTGVWLRCMKTFSQVTRRQFEKCTAKVHMSLIVTSRNVTCSTPYRANAWVQFRPGGNFVSSVMWVWLAEFPL